MLVGGWIPVGLRDWGGGGGGIAFMCSFCVCVCVCINIKWLGLQ